MLTVGKVMALKFSIKFSLFWKRVNMRFSVTMQLKRENVLRRQLSLLSGEELISLKMKNLHFLSTTSRKYVVEDIYYIYDILTRNEN